MDIKIGKLIFYFLDGASIITRALGSGRGRHNFVTEKSVTEEKQERFLFVCGRGWPQAKECVDFTSP